MGDRSILNLRGKQLIGLDIDSSSVRTVQLRRRNGHYVVTGVAVSDVAPWDNDPQLRRTNTTTAIRQCLETLGSGTKLAVCGLRGPEVVVRGFEFPVLPTDEIDGAVELEATQMCPFSTDDSTLDHQVTTADNRKTRGFWVAATHSLINEKRQMMRDAGLKCTLIDVDGLALLNALEGLTPEITSATDADKAGDSSHNRSAVLSVGDSCTSIAVADHVHRPFVRDLCSGEQDIIRRLVRETQLPPESIRAALYEGASVDQQVLSQGLEKACAALLDDIPTTLRFYTAENRFIQIDRILACGRLALAERFLALLSEKLSIEVVPWNPVADLRCEADRACESLLQEAGPTVAVAAGLAMRKI